MHLTPLPKPDTLHRETVRSQVVDSGPTIRTPLPGPTAGPTIQAPMPAAAATQVGEIVARPRRGGGLAIAVIAFLLLFVALAIGGGIFIKNKLFNKPEEVAEKKDPPVIPTPQPPSTTTVDVSDPTTTTTASTLTIVEDRPDPSLTSTVRTGTSDPVVTTTTVRPVDPRPVDPRPVDPRPVDPRPVDPVPVPQPQPVPSIGTFIDGDTGDSDVNDALLAELGRQLQGVNRIAIRSGNSEMREALVERIGRDTGFTVSDSATTVIDWDATLEDRGRGRKRRSASATITKNGRVIFRYRLPSEDFRVGDTPAEAFARILSEASNQ